MRRVEIKLGSLHIDGTPQFCLAGDYPYYRDDPDRWDDRLRKLKSMGLNTVTCYIPWRHHEVVIEGRRVFDFDGRTAPSRNVQAFLRHAEARSLWVIVKPGPFIHAETNFGGLPDRVSPENEPRIEAMCDDRGQPVRWLSENRRPRQAEQLPAPLDPYYLALLDEWFQAISRELLDLYSYPRGPVIGVQLCNEGIYSDGWQPPWKFDYSSSARALFQAWLNGEYRTIEVYNRCHGSSVASLAGVEPPGLESPCTTPGEVLRRLDWGRFQAYYLGTVYHRYRQSLRTDLPIIANINPLWEAPDADNPQKYEWWIGRIIPESWDDVNYGFTNWIGAVSHSESAFHRYMMLVKRARGLNLEENWAYVGHLHQVGAIGHDIFAASAVPAFQTLMAVALGATGYTIYTAVETSGWDAGLDTRNEATHPGDAPIRADGSITRKYLLAALLNGFFALEGRDLLKTVPSAAIAYGLCPSAAALSAWYAAEGAWPLSESPLPRSGYQGLDRFQSFMLQQNLDYALINLEDGQTGLDRYQVVCLRGPGILSAPLQEKLMTYSRNGGTLVIDGALPCLDERLQPCVILADALGSDRVICRNDAIHYRIGSGAIIHFPAGGAFDGQEGFLAQVPAISGAYGALPPGLRIWRHASAEKTYYFCFNFGTAALSQPFTFAGDRLRLVLPPKGCAVLALASARLRAGFIVGVHEYEGVSVAPLVEAGGDGLALPAPCDVLFRREGDAFHLEYLDEQGGTIRTCLAVESRRRAPCG